MSALGLGADASRIPVPAPTMRRARQSLTDQVRDAIIREFIASGSARAGERLPAEAEQCERYGVSRITVRAALRSVQEAGFITVRQGQGSTVLPHADAIASGIDQLCSFETFAARTGQLVETVDLDM